MEKIKTYIINLETSFVRRKYMRKLLMPYSFLDIEFIKAIDGRKYNVQELALMFDDEACVKHIGRLLNRGEIGCALSHRICYKSLLQSTLEFALILEDDIAPIRNLDDILKYRLSNLLKTETPTILFLSGDFWYYKRKSVVSVFDAVGAYAYIINRAAAKLILSSGKPFCVADDWALYRRKGLKMKALLPYMIDANLNMNELSSDVKQDVWGINRSKMSLKDRFWLDYGVIVKKFLKVIGHFEAKVRVINNVIVNEKK